MSGMASRSRSFLKQRIEGEETQAYGEGYLQEQSQDRTGTGTRESLVCVSTRVRRGEGGLGVGSGTQSREHPAALLARVALLRKGFEN